MYTLPASVVWVLGVTGVCCGCAAAEIQPDGAPVLLAANTGVV
jgi:hypothetical protein